MESVDSLLELFLDWNTLIILSWKRLFPDENRYYDDSMDVSELVLYISSESKEFFVERT